MAKIEKKPTGEFSSYYGCYIIAMAAFVFTGMIGWTAWSLFSQNRAIALFTQDEKTKLTDSPFAPDQETALLARLTAFGAAARSGQAAELNLTIDEMNEIIRLAPDIGYGSYRWIVRVTKTDPVKKHAHHRPLDAAQENQVMGGQVPLPRRPGRLPDHDSRGGPRCEAGRCARAGRASALLEDIVPAEFNLKT